MIKNTQIYSFSLSLWDDCMDAGDRAMQEAKAEKVRMRDCLNAPFLH
jgi:hypothetical protein